MTKAVYPGTFDPITYGHIDIIERSAKIVDELIVGILVNKAKVPMFTTKERIDMIRETVKHIPNVKVMSFDGLLIDFVKEQNAENTDVQTENVQSAETAVDAQTDSTESGDTKTE